MLNFVSNSKNPYAKQSQKEKTDCLNGKFIPKAKVGTIHLFANNTANINRRKITFKNV